MSHIDEKRHSEITCAEPRCPQCDSRRLVSREIEDRFPYGSGPKAIELFARIPVMQCQDCGLEFSGEEAERARHEAICKHLQLLAPREIAAIRQRYGLSRVAFAEVTRIGTATLGRWESGEIIQNPAMDAYMRLVARGEVFEELKSGALYAKIQTSARAAVPLQQDPFTTLGRRDEAHRRRLENVNASFVASDDAQARARRAHRALTHLGLFQCE